MRYLYHFASSGMRGSVLYPLNQLKNVYPDIYEREAAKYKGREHVMGFQIPTLDCLWNDVLFLMVVHPSDILRVASEVGLEVPWRMRMYRFDLANFDQSRLAVRMHRRGRRPTHEIFDPAKLAEYEDFEEDSRAYYRESMAKGERPMLPGHIPHIMYRGTLDITGVPIIEGQLKRAEG